LARSRRKHLHCLAFEKQFFKTLSRFMRSSSIPFPSISPHLFQVCPRILFQHESNDVLDSDWCDFLAELESYPQGCIMVALRWFWRLSYPHITSMCSSVFGDNAVPQRIAEVKKKYSRIVRGTSYLKHRGSVTRTFLISAALHPNFTLS